MKLRTLSEEVNSVAVQFSVLKRRLMNCEKMSGSAWQASVRRWLKIGEAQAVSFAALPWVPCVPHKAELGCSNHPFQAAQQACGGCIHLTMMPHKAT